jgi:hypothetical protein
MTLVSSSELVVIPPTAAHINRSHSRLGASSSYRWTNCHGSVLGIGDQPSSSSEAAREGTAGHELAQVLLENSQDAIEWVDRMFGEYPIDYDNWAEPLQVYLDKCREYMGPGWVWWIERPITLEKLSPPEPMYGTADFVAYNESLCLLVVIDLKFGKGLAVEAEGNPQLKYYALGTYLSLPAGTYVERIEAFIVQPRIPYGKTIKSTIIDPLELIEWSVWLIEQANIAVQPNAPLAAGPWCAKTFCPLSGHCKAEAQYALAFAQDEFDFDTLDSGTPIPNFPDVRTLTPEQVSGLLNMKPQALSFFSALEDYAKDGIRSGHLSIPGWTVTEGEGRAKFYGDDDQMIAERLIFELKLIEDEVYVRKLKTPPQIRKAIQDRILALAKKTGTKITKKDAEDRAKAALKPFTYTPSAGPKLVPVASGRIPIGAPGSEFPLLEAP